MGALDARGDVAIAFTIFYAILFVAVLSRSFLAKKFTWDNVLFFVLCECMRYTAVGSSDTLLVRIVSGILFTIYETQAASPRSGLFISAAVFHSIGLPVLLGCLAFFCSELPQLLFLIGHPLDDTFISIDLYLNIINAANTAGLILVTIADVLIVDATTDASRAHIRVLFKVSSFLFMAAFAALGVVYILFWAIAPYIFDIPESAAGAAGTSAVVSDNERRMVTSILRNCITTMLLAFPPLAVRVVYDILSAFAPAPIFSDSGIVSSDPGAALAKYSAFTGNWRIVLGMVYLMELLAVFVYIAARLKLPKTIQLFQYQAPPEPLKQRLMKRRK